MLPFRNFDVAPKGSFKTPCYAFPKNSGATDEQKAKMSHQLHELGKASNQTTKIIAAAEACLSTQPPDADFIEMNLTRLRQVGQEAEEVGYIGANTGKLFKKRFLFFLRVALCMKTCCVVAMVSKLVKV